MSEKSSSASHVPKSIDTLIGAGMRVDGDIACTGVLRVQGEILGNVSCRDDATLIVDSAGSVTGTVSATHVSVRGRIIGPVQSQQSIEVHAGGSLTGDVAFNRIAIHAGGIVDGLCSPAVAEDRESVSESELKTAGERVAPKPSATAAQSSRPGGGRKIGLAIVAGVVIAAGIWIGRHPEMIARSPGDVALRADSVLNSPLAPPSAPVAVVRTQEVPKVAEESAVPPPPSPPAAAQETVPASSSDAPERPGEKIVAVRGINPSRPAGVFLLISNDPSVLYRKMRDEPGEGTRVSVSGGEKASVAIARDELIRVAQGRDVVILFQGAKVPRNIIESGSWISFVPR